MTCVRGGRGALLAGLLASLAGAPPAGAIELIEMRIPLLDTSFTVRVSELLNPTGLGNGDSDLAELDRASNGALGRQLRALLNQPVPLSLSQIADGSVGSPLLEQAMLVLSSFGSIEGRPPDLSGESLRQALQQASRNGQPTLLNLIQAIPGERVRVDLGRARAVALRMAAQSRQAERLLSTMPPAPAAVAPQPAGAAPTSTAVTTTAMVPPGDGGDRSALRSTASLAVAHRPEALQLELIEPRGAANGRLVLISHGLWDGPASFSGWGEVLAGRGFTVILPRHPGSDSSQQRAVLAGTAPPPDPQELALRPKDLTAVLDGVGRLGLRRPVDPGQVVVLGHSWGATTALQLAGLRPVDGDLRARCRNLDDPERNLSWTLQCSWLRSVHQAAIQDRRVIAVGAVSPPASLLFPRGTGTDLSARILMVSGSRDWVVPPDPEAITPMRRGKASGNQLVLVQDGDHFNLRPGGGADGGVLGPLLGAWTEAAFAAGEGARPRPGAAPLLNGGAWGNRQMPMVDATPAL
ncbi:MAG: hypothetical protein RLZZ219_1243 [Cyanobacteriota bacterium]|jgi:predicted dienelactone hydrolase